MISCAGTFARLSNIRKYILLLAFWITSKTWQFHWSVLVMATPGNLTLSTRSSSWEFTVTTSKWCLTFLKSITSSLHLSAFSWSLLIVDHCSTALTATCIPLWPPLGTTSASVVSSTYFHRSDPVRSFKQLRRRPQRLLKKTKGLMIKTTALHVHHVV